MTKNNYNLSAIRSYWDEEAATFDNEPDHGLGDPFIRFAWGKLLQASLPSSPVSVLDMGCGTGSLSILLAELGHEVTGVDVSPAMIAYAEAKTRAAGYDIDFRLENASDPHLADIQFDVIICRHLLWALPDPSLALQRWSTLLSPHGRIVLIEGYWHTGGGLHAWESTAALPPSFTSVTVKDLSSSPELWGANVTDERYLVVAWQSDGMTL